MSTRVGRGVAAGEMPFEVLNPAARVCGIDASVGFTDSKGASLAWSAKRNFVKTKERSCDYLKSGKSGLFPSNRQNGRALWARPFPVPGNKSVSR